MDRCRASDAGGILPRVFFLEMAIRCADLDESGMPLPSGYAALLYLYGLR